MGRRVLVARVSREYPVQSGTTREPLFCIYVERNNGRGRSNSSARSSGKQRQEKCEGATKNERYCASELHGHFHWFWFGAIYLCNPHCFLPILKRCVRRWRGVWHFRNNLASLLSGSDFCSSKMFSNRPYRNPAQFEGRIGIIAVQISECRNLVQLPLHRLAGSVRQSNDEIPASGGNPG